MGTVPTPISRQNLLEAGQTSNLNTACRGISDPALEKVGSTRVKQRVSYLDIDYQQEDTI